MWSELDPRVTEKIFIREPRKQKETRNDGEGLTHKQVVPTTHIGRVPSARIYIYMRVCTFSTAHTYVQRRSRLLTLYLSLSAKSAASLRWEHHLWPISGAHCGSLQMRSLESRNRRANTCTRPINRIKGRAPARKVVRKSAGPWPLNFLCARWAASRRMIAAEEWPGSQSWLILNTTSLRIIANYFPVSWWRLGTAFEPDKNNSLG